LRNNITNTLYHIEARGISPTRTSVKSTSSNKDLNVKISRTLSHSQPSLTSPDKIPTAASMAANVANVAGRFKKPFSWLSRNQISNEKKLPTVTSPVFDYSASDTESGYVEPRVEYKSISNSCSSQATLKDRFKAVRMREEAGIDISSPIGDDQSIHSTVESPLSKVIGASSPPMERRPSSNSVSQTVNPHLAPGTASGIAEGPRDSSKEPVDWDLWQAIVTEGPAAVSRSSPEELNHAIAAGIPQAIRGVIWQVLSDSKNEQMEKFYHDLVARGTDKEKLANGHGDSNGNKEKESNASSASSVHSDKSNHVAGVNHESPSASVDGFTNPMAPKPKGPKDEVAHIQGLEKTIRRDLGARTSYSKYLISSGLQDGLFGICKAYALYDEEVGYAQGMNFIAMPLLFNVSFAPSD
jgi:hypothetical protein